MGGARNTGLLRVTVGVGLQLFPLSGIFVGRLYEHLLVQRDGGGHLGDRNELAGGLQGPA